MGLAIKRELASRNGGPGLTADELAVRLGSTVAIMRTELAGLVFAKDGGVTCVAESKTAEGRFVLGDSTPLRKMRR